MRTNNKTKCVFCLEGLWDNDLKYKSSVEPALDIIKRHYTQFDYIRKECATPNEFEYFLSKWPQSRYSRYSILYLAFHGEKGKIIFQGTNTERTLEEIGKLLPGACKNKIIIFSSCSTLDVEDTRISKFIDDTGAMAVCGYQSDIYWIPAVALDLLIIDTLQYYEFSRRGLKGIIPQIQQLSNGFSELYLTLMTKEQNKLIRHI